jgi:NADPH:quinone reductase-like Zn-dependent oxidoreductase
VISTLPDGGRPGVRRDAGSLAGPRGAAAPGAVRPSMRALRAHRRGGPEVLVTEDAPVPVPGRGEVLVAVRAAAVTVTELGWDATWTRAGRERTPVVVAHEFSGEVVATGPGPVRHRPGDEIYGLAPFDHDGAAAEFVAVPESCVADRPRTLSHARCAALALSGLTAWQALVDHARLAPGESVLVQGAAGGVGVFAAQLAVVLGGRVTASCRARDAAFVRGLGVRRVITIDRGPDDGASTGEGPDDEGACRFDVVVDCVGGRAAPAALGRVIPGSGRLVTLSAPLPPGRSERATFFVVAANTSELTTLADLADRYALAVPITATFGLERGQEAYRAAGAPGRAPGKTVIEVSPSAR